MKELLKKYWAPTPKRLRQIGDGLLAAGALVAAGGMWGYDTLRNVFTPTEIRYIIAGATLISVVGKFLTNCFKEEDKKAD